MDVSTPKWFKSHHPPQDRGEARGFSPPWHEKDAVYVGTRQIPMVRPHQHETIARSAAQENQSVVMDTQPGESCAVSRLGAALVHSWMELHGIGHQAASKTTFATPPFVPFDPVGQGPLHRDCRALRALACCRLQDRSSLLRRGLVARSRWSDALLAIGNKRHRAKGYDHAVPRSFAQEQLGGRHQPPNPHATQPARALRREGPHSGRLRYGRICSANLPGAGSKGQVRHQQAARHFRARPGQRFWFVG
ncbi:hypothetical protein J7T55_004184 [Diaporthe amygdali]|uniref:uncharacterized protein n=1 Tax=Phomopsis amygdali TaxID=1214568 RepID=UPI0022FE961C|nr:uncharacterized protein J7T55_004184 [Diaporthe amygdali]KAJ0116014.1 hypothetical protein J7T55_004184 [Diaporthe amygdali]